MPYVTAELSIAARSRAAGPASTRSAPRSAACRSPLRCGARPPAPPRRAGSRRGRYKASGLLTDEGLRVAWIDEPELRALNPALRCLANVNAPADLP